MRQLYNVGIYLALPFILLRLLYKACKNPAYGRCWLERFGYVPYRSKVSLWVHAVSVGEVIAAAPLIKQLKQRYPAKDIVVTTMTPTGLERVQAIFENQVIHTYIPYDYPGAIKRFIKRMCPQLVIMIETELWPNLLHICKQQNIPTILANARLSEKSMHNYRKISALTRQMLNNISLILTQGNTSAKNFELLGVNKKNLHVIGNLKFDIKIPEQLVEEAKCLRKSWGEKRTIIIAASTHMGEEEQLLRVFKQIRQDYPHILLILVPRHPDRFKSVFQLCQKQEFNTLTYSSHQPCEETTHIILGDTVGKLLLFYAASDIAFVGGSLIPLIGGHNTLEPAALSLPIITGQHTENFPEITQLLLDEKALIKIETPEKLLEAFIQLINFPEKGKAMGLRASKVIEQNRGSVEKHLQWIEKTISN